MVVQDISYSSPDNLQSFCNSYIDIEINNTIYHNV